MGMGTRRRRQRQERLWISHNELAKGPGHPFYARVNELLESKQFDEFAEKACPRFYAENNGRPSVTPGIVLHGSTKTDSHRCFLRFCYRSIATQRSRVAPIDFFPGIDCTGLKMNAISDTNSATQENVVPPRAARPSITSSVSPMPSVIGSVCF
jgi:hypothetical protein